LGMGVRGNQAQFESYCNDVTQIMKHKRAHRKGRSQNASAGGSRKEDKSFENAVIIGGAECPRAERPRELTGRYRDVGKSPG